MQIIGGHLEPHARATEAEAIDELCEDLDGIGGLAAAPAHDLVGERVGLELVALGFPGEHDERSGPRGDGQALEGLVALAVGADQPVDRDRMDRDQPIEIGFRDRLARAR